MAFITGSGASLRIGKEESFGAAAAPQALSYVTDLFLPIVDSETGDLRSLPFPGAATDQPYMTMQVIKLIQLNYRKHLADKMKKIKGK